MPPCDLGYSQNPAVFEQGTAVTATASYLVTASNPLGKTTASLSITVDPQEVPTGSISIAPFIHHTATLLPNGKVLIAGGTGNCVISNGAELYDPATETFVPTASMSKDHADHTATLLLDGKVLIAGGDRLNGAELYDPATETFFPTGSMSLEHLGHTATLLPNGKVLIAGGLYHDSKALDGTELYDDSVELYDPATGIFSPTDSKNAARLFHTATLLPNGKVLIAGGLQVYDDDALPFAELYDPSIGTFVPTGVVRSDHTATLLPNGKVLIAGGLFGRDPNPRESAELYDPAIETPVPTGSMSVARYSHTATLLLNGKVLIAGGGNAISDFASAEIYDPATETFIPTGSMSVARSLHTATLLPNGKVLIVGGLITGNPKALDIAELYDPASGTFSPHRQLLPHLTPTSNRRYACGGID